VIINVPPGTVVQETGDQSVVADLVEADQEIVVARGGKGGRGNYAFRSPSNQAPRTRTEGEPGDERGLVLTLKLIADVGLVGLPNAGKSTLLRALSGAHPVVAPYPFSTVKPVLGIVRAHEGASFCMIDIPGLIEGAHRGKGLGMQFLRHIERCRILVLLIDAAGEVPPGEAFGQLVSELGLYSKDLLERPRIVALNKMDLVSESDMDGMLPVSAGEGVFRISALRRQGLGALVRALYGKLDRESAPEGGWGR
jgi:GTP-binding protein